MRQVFVSYSLADFDYADALVAGWRSEGLRVWQQAGIDYGTRWREVIEGEIRQSDVMVVLMSVNSGAALWVARELRWAQHAGVPVAGVHVSGEHFLDNSFPSFDGRSGAVPTADWVRSIITEDRPRGDLKRTVPAPPRPQTTASPAGAIELEFPLRAVSWSPTGSQIATSDLCGGISVMTSGLMDRRRFQVHEGDWVWRIVWSPDGTRLASCGHDGQVIVTSVDDGRVEGRVAFDDWVWGVDWHPSGHYLAAAGFAGDVAVIDLNDSRVWPLSDSGDWCWTVKWSPDGRYLASAGVDGTITVWNPLMGQRLKAFRGHSGGVFHLDWSPDGRHLVSAGHDTTIRVWQIDGHFARQVLTGHTAWVNDVKWSPGGQRIVSCSSDGTVRVWHTGIDRLGEARVALQGRVTSVDWNPDGSMFVAANESVVRIFSLSH